VAVVLELRLKRETDGLLCYLVSQREELLCWKTHLLKILLVEPLHVPAKAEPVELKKFIIWKGAEALIVDIAVKSQSVNMRVALEQLIQSRLVEKFLVEYM